MDASFEFERMTLVRLVYFAASFEHLIASLHFGICGKLASLNLLRDPDTLFGIFYFALSNFFKLAFRCTPLNHLDVDILSHF